MSIIQVQNLSKRFILQHEKSGAGKYTALRDVITDKFKSIGKKQEFIKQEEFWALHDVSFEVNQGDRVGIIGRNGAGKSTLLKILSRITEPTSGRVKIKGRVASLLEVGTGFHPELTGRENIFLNGAILGMSSAEVRKKFDEIVDFAEVEKFLDTPVKRYSSGMYVRLAFAVAAHLEPEILVVDEVLAVGDAQFQKKCLGKMEDVSVTEGRTLLFVSHNTAALLALCNKGIVLSKGMSVHNGSIISAVSMYNEELFQKNRNSSKSISNNLIVESFIINTKQVWSLDDLSITVKFRTLANTEAFKSVVIIIEQGGKRVGIMDLRSLFLDKIIAPNTTFECNTIVKSIPLTEGDYELSIYIETSSIACDFNGLAYFSVLPRKQGAIGFTPYDVTVRGSIEFIHDTEIKI